MMMMPNKLRAAAQLLTLSLVAPEALAEPKKSDKCKVLSLKGGGIHGAWEAGVIQGIVEHMPSDLIDY
eukprot:CAMPEP_0185573092 /NCGR_PEP_ID=MMETSP0434-20130131/4895_1 /TAXON_ID=626734 ORGANISM="Favella taraikaensis, Strain Fe Narragansett Bay" /NCGR_SAMPLE_ID=MMETSP0434 /ASSEMBLY_ACC=CAM_ASM_000379 /LENGTH=67 /DNA_ID=CAMNT_0028189213 /DNA_START=20 /DNA_END=223 /DNA_ORIENTATION=-